MATEYSKEEVEQAEHGKFLYCIFAVHCNCFCAAGDGGAGVQKAYGAGGKGGEYGRGQAVECVR